MKDSRNPLAVAIRFALSAGTVVGLAVTTAPSFAQEQETEDAETADRIQVTGSRISRSDLENISPITNITREEIEMSGYQTIGDILSNLAQADSLGLTNVTSSTNANDGTQTISLRGLGATRTLVLVDGRRWLALGGGQVDLTQIPTAIVERVEILADGASAIYGSDAIAGVVNIITRDNFQGLSLNGFYGENEEGDDELREYGLSFGHTGDRGSLFVNFNKVEQDPVRAGDRAISSTPVRFVPDAFGSFASEFGVFITSQGLLSSDPAFDPSSGVPTQDDFVPFSDALRFNFAPTNFLKTPSDRLTAFVKGDYDFTGLIPGFDDLRFISQFTYNQRKSVTQIAPVPLFTNLGLGPQWEFGISADSAFNPFGEDINQFALRMPNNRTNVQDFDTYFGTWGFQGTQNILDREVDWEATYSRGESSRAEEGLNFVNLLRLQQGIGPSFFDPETGQAVCGTQENPTPFLNGRDCVPVNPFGGRRGLTPEMLNFVETGLVQKVDTGMREWQFNVTTSLIELPAGPLGIAAGYERRTNSFTDNPDSTISAGINSTNFREPTNGEQMAEEFFFELAIPLLADLPLAEYLELSVAGRFSDFENEGLVGNQFVSEDFDDENFKFGFLYRPIDDLMLRGTYSETFRAPSVANLFAGGGEGFPQAIDPCTNASFAGNPFENLTPEQQQRCFDQGVPAGGAPQPTSQLRSLAGGNPNLDPEDGETRTIGFVYTPNWLSGFDMTVDYWDIELDDTLASRGAGTILNDCIREGDPDLCGFIERDVTGQVATVRTSQFNLATVEVKGIDFSGNYRLETDIGRFTLGTNWTWTDSAKATIGELSDAQELVGEVVGVFGGPTWEWRGNTSLDWSYSDFGISWTMRYFSSLEEDCGGFETLFDDGIATRQLCSQPNLDDPELDARNDLSSRLYHDLALSYQTPFDSTIRAGVRNLLDKDPPRAVSPFANSFDQSYDIPGSFWWVSLEQRF